MTARTDFAGDAGPISVDGSARYVGALFFLALSAACDPAVEAPLTFTDAFPEVRRITLEEDLADPIVGFTSLAVGENGDLIVTDQASSKVRVFARDGRLLRTLGRRGDGPGELDGPRWAAAGTEGEIRVVEQGSPRVTIYWADDSVTVGAIPGHYGSWIAPAGSRWVVGAATRTTRFATLTEDDVEAPRYGTPPDAVTETPFWIFFAKDRGTVVGDGVWINNSFSPELRIFDLEGSEVANVGAASPNWIGPTAPPIDRISLESDRARIEEWSRTFTVVSSLVARRDSLVFVQVGRHAPADQDPYYVEPAWVDVYEIDGTKRYEELLLHAPIAAGGDHVYVLASQPPEGWVLTVH